MIRRSGVVTRQLVAGYLYDTDGKLKPYLFHHDHLTSTAAVSGHNGGTLQSIQYGAFGTLRANSGSSPNRLKYTGREDDGTGLYYYRARYYDPGIGRFISEDPLGFEAGEVNFYAYVGNDPVNANDPSGNCPSCVGAGTSVLLGGAIRYFTSGGDWGAVFDPKAIAIDAVAGAVGAGIVNKANQLVRLKDVPVSLAQKLSASGSTKIDQGVYLIESSSGKYVGQSGQIPTRFTQHATTGKFTTPETSNAVRLSVGGGKTSREVAEQRVLVGAAAAAGGGANALGASSPSFGDASAAGGFVLYRAGSTST